MDERRQLHRWGIKKEAMVWLPQTQDLSYCVIENMYLKGMRISCNKRLPQHQAMSMSFAIGDDFGFINIEVQVPRGKEDHGRYVYGLTFTKITDEDKKRLYQYISTN